MFGINLGDIGKIAETVVDPLGVIRGAGNMLSGKGPDSMNPANIQGGAFKDPQLEENKKLLEQQRQAGLQAGQQGLAGQSQVSGQQQALIQQMQARAAGQSPSIAEMQMQRGGDQARAALASQAATMRGAPAGLAQRGLARTQAGLSQDLVGQASMLRAQEQQAAEQGLAGMLQGTRSQDQALMQQGQNLALQYMQLGMTADQAQFMANQELERLRQGARQSQAETGVKQQSALIGGLGTVGAALLSDKNQKTNIEASSKDVSKFLNSLSAKKYDYKDGSMEGAAHGKRYGIIAQDLEKSDMGKSLVMDTPNGKMIDTNQTVGALLAAVSHLNKRLEKAGK